MKIAFVNKYQGKVNRGAETFVSELSKRLSKNHEVDVLNKINFLKKYDIVIPTNGRLQVFVARVYSWLTGAKMAVSGQSGVGLDDRLNLYAFPDAFVSISSYALEKSKKRNPFVKCVYIPNGVDLDKFSFKVRNLQGKSTVLSVGAFTEQKRHELVIKAVAKIKKLAKEYGAEKIVIGMSEGIMAQKSRKFGDKLGLKVEYHDETLTSKQAQANLKHKSRQFRSQPQDAYQAAVMLQDWLDGR